MRPAVQPPSRPGPAPWTPPTRTRPARGGLGLGLALVALLLLQACGAATPPPTPPADPASAWQALGLGGTLSDFEGALAQLRGIPLDPPPEVGEGYSPEFPPDRPFEPSGWTTRAPSPSVAEPARARPGGILRLSIAAYPPTLRTEGPNSRLKTLSDLHVLIYEPLLDFDMALGDYVPRLASHWWVSPDKKTFRFRLDPRARWADGAPVTSDDVKATFEHMRREDRQDPSVAEQYEGMIEAVEILDRLTVEVRTREARWMNLLQIGAGTKIYPARYIRMDGATYLSDWNWKLPPGSGPYELRPEDLEKDRSITVRRRQGWWDGAHPRNAGTYNFEAVRWEVIRDEELEYQKFLAGELDALQVLRAQRWVDEVDREEAVRQGWVQKRKIYSMEPQGYGGYCFNMRVAPFRDRNVRLAFSHLFHREKLFEKFFFFQYDYIDSYFPGQIYRRPGAERVRYDPRRARQLLAASGWTRRDGQGFLCNQAGQRFPELTLEFAQAGFDRIHQVTADELWKQAGIKLHLKLVDYPSLLKKVWDYKFTVTYFSWTASPFPDPEFQFASKLADEPQSNNLNGFKDPEADRLFEAYKGEFDQARRIQLLHRLDRILFEAHPYALGWYAPYFRVLYWDRFGHPPEYTQRFTADLNEVIRWWWFDPARSRATEENRAAGRPNHPDRPGHQGDEVEHRYWLDHDLPGRAEPAPAPAEAN